MKVVAISVTYARTFNLGDYNSMRLECAISAELSEDDSLDAAQEALWLVAKDSVKAQAMPVLRKREDEIAAIRASLPPDVTGK